jgi:hypothetical protein
MGKKIIYKDGDQLSKAVLTQLCKDEGLPTPIFDYSFHNSRLWRIDIYMEHNQLKLGIEIEGGVYGSQVVCHKCHSKVVNQNGKPVMTSGGRHTHFTGYKGDMEKYNTMAIRGIFLMRFTPGDVFTPLFFNNVKQFFNVN